MKKIWMLLIFSLGYCNLITPSNESYLNHIHVLFEWTQIPEASNYDLQISESEDFSVNIIEIRKNSLAYIEKNQIDWGKTYYWRIRPIFGTNPGSWIESYSFTTGEPLSSSIVNTTNQCCYSPGITVFGSFFNYFSAAINENGEEIWNTGTENFVYYNTSQYGNVFGCHLVPGLEHNLPGSEITFQGETIWQEPNTDFLHHDMIRLPNGNYLGIVETISYGPIPIGPWTTSFLALGFQADGITPEFPWVGDKIVEWDKDTKEVVWSWNVFDHYDMIDYDEYGGTWNEAYLSLRYDWTHANALLFDENESSIYISVRHLSRITKIDYPSGNIIWNLGHEMPSGEVNMGSNLGFSFQHSLQKLENGNIITFDNGNLSEQFRGTEEPISRAIEINIDNNIASINWEYELTPDLFGFASGNAQKLDNGNYLITTVGGGGRSIEVNNDGEIVWEGLYNLSLPDGAVYRAHRIPGLFPNAYSIIINNYMEYNGDIGVYLAPGSSDISFTIINESRYPLPLLIRITDNENWFETQEIDIHLASESEQVVSFTGDVTNISSSNPIQLNVIPTQNVNRSKIISVDGFTSPLTSNIKEIQPSYFSLNNPYPNPFNASTMIQYSLDKDLNISIQVYNLKGKLIDTLVDKRATTGKHNVIWNANNHPSGVYFIKTNTDRDIQVKKLLLLK